MLGHFKTEVYETRFVDFHKFKVNGYISIFSIVFTKPKNFSDFLLASLDNKALPKLALKGIARRRPGITGFNIFSSRTGCSKHR